MLYDLSKYLPDGLSHFEGLSDMWLLLGSLRHFKPFAHFPQSKFVSGLKQAPQVSPSCFVPAAVFVKNENVNLGKMSLIIHEFLDVV